MILKIKNKKRYLGNDKNEEILLKIINSFNNKKHKVK